MDFVDQQGLFCLPNIGVGELVDDCYLLVPPIENFIGFSDPDRDVSVSLDYAGLANKWIEAQDCGGNPNSFDTTFSGSVTERRLPDGRAEVHVRLHTENALAWVIEGTNFFAPNKTIFGSRADDVCKGVKNAKPVLADVFLHVVLINTGMGDPLPDLIPFLIGAQEPGQELRSIKLSATAQDDDEVLVVRQTGLLDIPGQGQAILDGFPVENVILVKQH